MKKSQLASLLTAGHRKIVSVVAMSVFFLAACGGDGANSKGTPSEPGSSDGPPKGVTPVKFAVTAASPPASVDENTSATFSVSFSGANGDITATAQETSTTGITLTVDDITADGATINIAVPELENDKEAGVVIAFTNGDAQTMSYTFETHLTNRSGIEALKHYETAAIGAGTFVNLIHERELYSRFQKLIAMEGISIQEIPQFPENLDLVARADLINFSNTRTDVVSDYKKGKVTESEVKAKTMAILETANRFVSVANKGIESLLALSSGVVPELPLNSVFLNKENGISLSQFVGNEQLGSYSAEWFWTFNSEYQFLSQITQNNQSCQAAQ